jgi:cytochrome c biogenesis protein CcmG/thiol:disulfide interchange protein DsbE
VLVASSVVGVMMVGLVALLASRQAAPGTVATSNLGGKPAPPVVGRNLFTGAPVSLAADRGRYVLVDFFASWCAACQDEAPAIEQFLFSHRRAHDVAVIGVDSTTDTKLDAEAFLERTGATFPAISDPGGRIADSYGVASPPQSYLVAPDGRIAAWIPGGVTAASLDALVPVPRRGS